MFVDAFCDLLSFSHGEPSFGPPKNSGDMARILSLRASHQFSRQLRALLQVYRLIKKLVKH